jgi:AraC-like DNA-binding protein
MQFAHRVPRAPLDRFIESIWLYRNDPRPHALERVLPTGAVQLIVNLKEDETRLYDAEDPSRFVATAGTVLSSMQTRFQVIDTSEQESVAGVVFRPGGTVPFVRVPAHETSDADVPLAALWNERRTAELRERLLESAGPDAALDALETALFEALTPSVPHPAVSYALGVFERAPVTPTIATVSDAIGLSAKRFIERFKIDVGLTPKRYCRVRRFQRALKHAHQGRDVDWTQVALDCGYFDQAHFIHDFRGFAGLTPTGYRAGRTSFQNHVKFLQSADEAM